MSYPNYPNKQRLEAVLNPQDMIAYRRLLKRLPRFEKPEGVLFSLEKGLARKMRRKVPVRFVGNMIGELYQLKKAPKVGVMTNFGGGAPILVELAEELIAMGARKMIILTWGGTLQHNLQAGDVVVCERAIRDEGVSYHYLEADKTVEADARLTRRLAEALKSRGLKPQVGTTWTTDAPFRETVEEVRQYQQEGVMTVELEAAGLFALGKVRGVETAAVVVVMDSLAGLKWEAPARLEAIIHSLETAYLAAIEVLSED